MAYKNFQGNVMDYKEIYESWLNDERLCGEAKAELETITPFPAGREKIDGVAHDAEIATFEGEVIAVVLHGDEVDEEVLLTERVVRLG